MASYNWFFLKQKDDFPYSYVTSEVSVTFFGLWIPIINQWKQWYLQKVLLLEIPFKTIAVEISSTLIMNQSVLGCRQQPLLNQGLVSMSQWFTSPNYCGFISNRCGWRWCETHPQKGTLINPCQLKLVFFRLAAIGRARPPASSWKGLAIELFLVQPWRCAKWKLGWIIVANHGAAMAKTLENIFTSFCRISN